MTRRMPIVFLVVVAVGCSPAEQLGTTTTSLEGSGSTSTTGTMPPTTSPSSTTTSTVPSTTTTTLQGNWAEMPVLTSGIANMTLGW